MSDLKDDLSPGFGKKKKEIKPAIKFIIFVIKLSHFVKLKVC